MRVSWEHHMGLKLHMWLEAFRKRNQLRRQAAVYTKGVCVLLQHCGPVEFLKQC